MNNRKKGWGFMEKENGARSKFSGRLGFILAAAGSAVGLGNIWRFPYLAAKYGGGIFLLVYLILAVTFGFSMMIMEIAIGRKTGKSAIGAYAALDKRFGFLGVVASAIPIIIFPYYCVIGGWVVKYITVFASGDMKASAADGYFESFIGRTGEPIVFLAVFMILTAAVILLGVQKGVEKVSTVLMPMLVLLTLGIAIYSLTIDGAWDGFLYYVKPNFEKFSFKTIVGAMGQLFYSMSLAMGIMITYGSYMRKEDDLEKSVRHIELFDTVIAFLAGMMIIPAVYAFAGGDTEKINAGAGLMFITLPKVFNSLASSVVGRIVGLLFFVLVLLAALTSAISLMETIVSIFCDKLKVSRRKIAVITAAVSFVLALPSTLGYGALSDVKIFGYQFLDFFDFISNNILMPIVALATCILIGWVVKTKTIEDEVESSGEFKSKKLFRVMIKFISPIFMLMILISSVVGYVS